MKRAGRSLPAHLIDRHSEQVRRVAIASTLVGATAVSALILRAGPLTIGDLFLLMGAGLAVLLPSRPRRAPLPFVMPLAVAGCCALVGGLVAANSSLSPMTSVLVLVRLALLVGVVPWQLIRLFTDVRGLRWLFLATALGSALCGLGGLAQMAIGLDIPGAEVSSAGRVSGLTGHVSDAGAVCALGVVIGFGLLGHAAWSRADIAPVIVFLVSGIGLILSGSVAGMSSSVVGVTTVLLLSGLSRGKAVLSLGLIGVASVVGSMIIKALSTALTPVDRLLQVLGLQQKYAGTDTSASRWETIKAGWTFFSQHPFTGAGLDTSRADVYQGLPVHNLMVALLQAGGLLFAAGVVAMFVIPVVGAFAVRQLHPLAPLAVSLAVSQIFFSGTAPGYYSRYFWVPMALCRVVISQVHEALSPDVTAVAPAEDRVIPTR